MKKKYCDCVATTVQCPDLWNEMKGGLSTEAVATRDLTSPDFGAVCWASRLIEPEVMLREIHRQLYRTDFR